MNKLYKIFVRGLLAILPVVITVYLVVWLVRDLEALFGDLIRRYISEALYFPGLGLMVGLIVVFTVGLMLQTWLARTALHWAEALVERLPVIKSIYGYLKDFMEFLGSEPQAQESRVVAVTLGNPPIRMLGIMTRESLADAPAGLADPDRVVVYLPWSYQIGGFTVCVPRAAVTRVDMTTEEALRWTITAGIGKDASDAA